MGQVDVDALERESKELIAIIEETNSTMGQPKSNLAEAYIDTLKRPEYAYKLVQNVQKMPKDPQSILGGVIILAAGWGVAKGMDAIANARARRKAREALIPVYTELVSKQGLIIDEMKDILTNMQDKQNKSDSELSSLQKRYDQLKELGERIGIFRKKVEN